MPGALLLSVFNLRKRQLNTERLKKRYLRDLSNPMEVNETFFISLYRLNKMAFKMVLEKVAVHLPKSSIPATIQLAAVLRFLAVGSYQAVIANDLNISLGRSTFCKILWNVMNALEDTLCDTWIKISLSPQSQSASKTHFYQKFGIPGVVGSVDGTLIKIMKPPCNHAVYFSRKGHYSLNVMIICDYQMRILAVDACRPGSCHDSFVWKMSDAERHYQDMYSRGAQNWLLGDSGYGLTPYLMTPYKNPQYATVQHVYNQRHASARNIVERTIGVLKSRFRCLQSSLMYIPSKVVTIINVCSALHNICKHYGIAFEEQIFDEIDDYESTDIEEDGESLRNAAIAIRDNIARSIN